MSLRIDLNADVGEKPDALTTGRERDLLRHITSANVACGGHAGNEESMRSLASLCLSEGVALGAHPGFPDPGGFGRRLVDISVVELERSLVDQIQSLLRVASSLGVPVCHVKPHGALYNAATADAVLANVVARAVGRADKNLLLVGLAGSRMLEVWRSAGFGVVAEAFADRRYEPDGSLRSRKHADAVIDDPGEASRQACDIVCGGSVRAVDGSRVRLEAQTLCIHGDTKGAVAIAAAVRKSLLRAGVELGPIRSSPR